MNSFIDYTETILNKSPNTIKEYNYDLNNFLKYMKMRLKLTKETEMKNVIIKDITVEDLKKITIQDVETKKVSIVPAKLMHK